MSGLEKVVCAECRGEGWSVTDNSPCVGCQGRGHLWRLPFTEDLRAALAEALGSRQGDVALEVLKDSAEVLLGFLTERQVIAGTGYGQRLDEHYEHDGFGHGKTEWKWSAPKPLEEGMAPLYRKVVKR